MDASSEERVDILLKLGNQTIQQKVPYNQKGILLEAEKLYNDYYDRLRTSPRMKSDEKQALTILALQFAIKFLELRNSKEDNVLAPAMEKTLSDIEEALVKLEEQQ